MRFLRISLVEAFAGERELIFHRRYEFRSIARTGDGIPIPGRIGDIDAVVNCQTIGELTFAIASPNNSVNGLLFGELEFDLALTLLVRHPTPRIAVVTVVDEAEFMPIRDDGVTGRRNVGGECDIDSGRVEDLQFVYTWFQIVCRKNYETQ